jgi:hypothetical protein
MRYGIYHKGVLALSCLTLNGAKSKAWELCKAKGWDMREVEIRPINSVENVVK